LKARSIEAQSGIQTHIWSV